MDKELITTWLTDQGVTILIILIAAVVAYRLLLISTRTLSKRIQLLDDIEGSDLDKRTITVFRIVRSSGVVIIVGTAVIMILSELGIPVTPVLASVGFVGLAFGLGAQTLVKDIISGLFVLLENQYTVGDAVEISGVSGTVEAMTLRATMIRDLYGTFHIIPNGEIRVVANKSRDWSLALVEVNISYEEDIDTALTTLQLIGDRMMADETINGTLLESPVVTGVEGLDEWAIRLRITAKTLPGGQWGIQRYLRRQIRLVFAEKGIDLAFPRQEVRMITPEKGDSAL